MDRLNELTIGDLLKALSRYRPFILTVVGVALIAVVLPGSRQAEDDSVASPTSDYNQTQVATGTDQTTVDTTGTAVESGTSAAAGAVNTGRGTTRTASGTATGTAATTGGGVAPATAGTTDPLSAPDCDKTTGRIALPSNLAPNCVPLFSSDNGGATYKGVTKDTIKIVLYIAEEDAQSDAILAAAGASDDTSDEEDDENRNKVIDAYEAHFETYGRHVIWEKLQASGPADDDAAARADAIRAATEMGAFAVLGGPGVNSWADELHARGIVCFCTVSQPIENYLAWAPHVWSTLMASTQGYVHRAEYACRLKGGKAQYTTDTVMQQQERKIALVYYEQPDGAYKAGAQFFERELQSRCGWKLTDNIAALYKLEEEQEHARVIIARLKEKGVTTVAFAGHPFQPIFLTKEATNQNFFPEWMITGSALTDTTFFARTYSPEQWRNAFGVSFLVARTDPDAPNVPNLVEWHYGAELTSYPNSIALFTLYTGIHLAGPRLTPDSYRDGMFAFKPTSGFITDYAVSYGRGLWPWDDYLALDDTTEIWWDPQARGPDELGNDAVGMYRYVDGGKRYLPNQWPKTVPKPFVAEGTVVMYTERPKTDFPKNYEHSDTHVRGPKKG